MTLPTTPTGADFDLRALAETLVACCALNPMDTDARFLSEFGESDPQDGQARRNPHTEPRLAPVNQKMILPLSCICLAVLAVPYGGFELTETAPKLVLETSLFGIPSTGWLKMLKASARNSNLRFSQSGKDRITDESRSI